MNLEKLTKYRRDLHQIPELGFDLYQTSEYVRKVLVSFGFEPKIYAKTGLVAYKKGKKNSSVAFRADMDALPVLEATGIEFKSKHDGKMHACGHDGHTAMLLGFAEYVSKNPVPEEGIVLLFQPAEEGPGGAKVMLDEGVFDDYKVTKVFGLHLFPGIEEGKVGIKEGPMLAQNGEFWYTVLGTSSHGAQPHLGKDAVLAASTLVVELNHIVSRFIDPLEPAVVTTGTINGGEATNIISNRVQISGTIRAFSNDVYQTIKMRMEAMVRGIEQAYSVKIDGGVKDYYPPVVNDSALFKLVESSLSADQVIYLKPYMFAEDFAFYQQKVPGIFSFIGSKNENKGYIHPLHSNYFNFDEKILLSGVQYYVGVAKKLGLYK